jgi:hypothetical protein
MVQFFFAQVNTDEAAKKLEEAVQDPSMLKYVGAVLAAALVLYILVKVFGGKKKHPDLEKNQREKLAEYPAAPKAGGRTITLHGEPARIRLIVVAPQGKNKQAISADDVPELMGDLLRGLTQVVKADKPRIRIWPVQLSVEGFAPTFHRLVESPDAEGAKSRWVRLAGPVKIGGKQFLLGIALQTETPLKDGKMIMTTGDWSDYLGVS